MDSNNIGTYVNRGIAESNLGLFIESINDFSKALIINLNDENATFQLGISETKLKWYPEAIFDFSLIIKSHSKRKSISDYLLQQAYFNRGIVQFQMQCYEDAIDDINQAVNSGV